MRFALIIILFSQISNATDFKFNKKINPSGLRDEARAAGFSGAEVFCRGNNCVLQYDDSVLLDPAPIIAAHVFIAPATKRAALAAELADMMTRIDRPMSGAEIRRLIFLIVKLGL